MLSCKGEKNIHEVSKHQVSRCFSPFPVPPWWRQIAWCLWHWFRSESDSHSLNLLQRSRRCVLLTTTWYTNNATLYWVFARSCIRYFTNITSFLLLFSKRSIIPSLSVRQETNSENWKNLPNITYLLRGKTRVLKSGAFDCKAWALAIRCRVRRQADPESDGQRGLIQVGTLSLIRHVTCCFVQL